MKSTLTLIACTFAWILTAGLAGAENNGLNHVSAGQAEFVEVAPGIAKAVLWGDHDAGPYGAFTRFDPGADAGKHSHSHDIRIVVLKGAYLYRDDEGEARVGPGDFFVVAAGKAHWSGSDAEAGALFYEASDGGFDLVPAE